eukprot:195372_1
MTQCIFCLRNPILNVINCILNGTLETDNKHNYDFRQQCIDLCALLLDYQLHKPNDNVDIPDYIANLLNRYCSNLKHIMVFWHHMEMVPKLKHLCCNEENNGMFFDLNVL